MSFWNVCYKAQVCRCSIAFLRHETLIFHCSKMFSEKLIWQSNIRNFDILKCLLFGSTFEMKSFASFLKRIIFTVLKYLTRKFDLTIKFQKFCRFEMFYKAFNNSWPHETLSFNCSKILENWFDHQISEILTFWNVCYMTQLYFRNGVQSFASFLKRLYFTCLVTMFVIWKVDFLTHQISEMLVIIEIFDIKLVMLKFDSTFEMLNRFPTPRNAYISQ